MKYCAVCLIAKDEEYYLEEWAEYHLRIGVDTLIIYDNGSRIPIREVLKPLVAIGRVIVHDVPGLFEQSKTYTSCIEQYKNDFKWIAFIDSDEFIFLKKTDNIKLFLAAYEEYGGVVANWVNFGTSGLRERKDKSQIFNFTLTDNSECSTIKSIVQPKRVTCYEVHGAVFLDNYFAVSSNHVPLHNACYSSPFINDKIQINHYLYRSYEDYQFKSRRWIEQKICTSTSSFDDIEKKYTELSLELIRFYVPFKKTVVKPYYADMEGFSSVRDCTQRILSLIQQGKILEAELACCQASCIFYDEALIPYFRSILSRLQNDLQQALRYIYYSLRLSGSSTIYYEYSRVLEQLGEHEKARLAKKHGDYKKYVEDTTCAPIIE